MIDTSKLVTKDYLKKFGDKSKRLFKANPVHTKMDGTYGNWILVETLIDYNLGFDELCLNIQGISFDEYIENKKLINSSFYVTTDSQSGAINYASGLNLGQDGIQAVVFVSASSSSAGEAPKLLIWLKLSDDRYIDETIIDIIACKEEEVLFQTITSVDYNSQPDEPVEYKQIASDSDHKPFSDPIIGTIISQLTEATQFTIVEDQVVVEGEPVPTEYKTYPETSIFNRIFSSKESDQLSHGLIFQYDWENPIGSEDNPVTITNGELISGQVVKIPIPDLFANGADSHDQWVNQVKVENGIVTDVQSGIPLAKSTQIGGMYLDGSPSSLTVNQYPVKLTAQGIGYVNIPASDVHRYANLNNVPSPKVGDIVQYIGSTTSACTNGFFYQYWPEAFTASIPSNLYWNTIGTGSDMANAIAAYNESLSYLLRPNVGISITLKPVTLYQPGTQTELADGTTVAITDDTLFTVSQGDYSVDLSYADIKTHFTIELKPQYVSYTYYGSQSTQAHSDEPHWTVPVTFDEATFEQEPPLRRHWVQKNVQPVINMQSALVYKGTVQTMADLQALTPTAQTGDFYTVTQLSNQEYFFTGTDWEFMGDVFTVDGSLTIKSKDSQSAETDVATFTANQSGNTCVELVAGTAVELTADTTDPTVKKVTISSSNTTYSAGKNINIDTNNNNSISALGYTYNSTYNSFAVGTSATASNNNAFAEGSGTASDYHAHAEGCGTTASGHSAHAEGYHTTASNYYTHAEGESTQATYNAAHAEGKNTIAQQYFGHAEGYGSKTSATMRLIDNVLVGAGHAEGYKTEADAITHAEGYETKATGQNSHAEGKQTTTLGEQSHTEGGLTTALGNNSHAEGSSSYRATDQVSSLSTATDTAIKTAWESTKFTLAKASGSHAEGKNTLALGDSSHAEGEDTIAEGAHSHASGHSTIADYNNMTAIGKCNSGNDSPNLGNYLFQVGNGTGAAIADRSNAFAVLENGIAQVQRNVIGKIIPQDYTTTIHNTLTIDYKSEKYNFLRADGNCTITVNIGAGAATNDAVKCASDIIVHIENTTGSAITLSVVEGGGGYAGTLINMWDANLTNGTGLTLAAGQHAELCFTFWYRSHVSFNGGLSVSVS